MTKVNQVRNWPFLTVKAEIEKYLFRLGLRRWNVKPYKTELPEGQAYDISHPDYGELGQLSILPGENETHIRFTKPIQPELEESVTAFIKAGYTVPKKLYEAQDWLLQRREEKHEKFYTELLVYLETVCSPKSSKRKSTLANEQLVIKTFKDLQRRNEKEFREAFYQEDIKKRKVTAQDIFDVAGDKLGYKNSRPIQKILKEYREKNKKKKNE